MSEQRPADSLEAVHHDERGAVWVGSVLIAPRPWKMRADVERIVTRVRERTSDEWWRTAAAILETQEHPGTGGPIGEGVDFLLDDDGLALLVPPDARAEIQMDAYEAAREVIVQSASAYARCAWRAIQPLCIDGAGPVGP